MTLEQFESICNEYDKDPEEVAGCLHESGIDADEITEDDLRFYLEP